MFKAERTLYSLVCGTIICILLPDTFVFSLKYLIRKM